jgi:two-component system OmpR family response regulator
MAKLLLVDDDLDVIDQYRSALDGTGHEVAVAYSATEARGLLKRFTPDLAVVDIMMEDGIPGFDLAQEIAARFPAAPILMVSSLNEQLKAPLDFTPSDQLPITKFLDKPVNASTLVREINQALAEAKRK